MAMSNGMGIAADTGKVMSISLTGLAGDMASFFNVSQDVAKTALNSVFTGETESLKKFGVILTEANLKAFALSKGITKSYTAMTQAEKVMLRYQFVMEALAQTQGDFARTSGTWANQVRILKEQWSQLLSILGKGLNTVLLPLVKALNQMLSSLIAVANAMAKAFGGKGLESASGKVESSVGNIASGTEDATTGFEDTTAAAKELAKTVAGFDELNILNSSTSGSTEGLGVDTSATTTGSAEVIETEVENPASKLADYIKECKAIIDKWVSQIPKLEINFDKDKAIENLKGIGLNILDTIAGWGTFVVSIGIQLANDLDIGAIANSFLNFIESATGLASAITDSVVPALQTFYQNSGLQQLVQWIGEKLANGLDGAAEKMDSWAQWFRDNKDNINTFAQNLGLAVAPLTEIVIQIADTAWEIFAGLLERISAAMQNIATWLIGLDASQIQAILLAVGGIGVAFGAAKGAAELFGVSLGTILKNPILAIESFKTLLTGHILPHIGLAWDGIVSKFSGAIGTITGAFGAILTGAQTSYAGVVNQLGASQGVFTTLKGCVAGVGGGFKALWGIIAANPIAAIVAAIALVVASVVTLWNKSEEFRNFVKDLWENTLKPIVDGIVQAAKDLWENHLKPLWENSLKPLIKSIGEAIKGMWDTISTVVGWVVGILSGIFLSTFGNVFGQAFKTVTETIGAIADILGGLIDFISGVFSGDWRKAWDGVKKIFKGVWDGLVAVVKAPINLIIGLINGLVKGICSGVNAIIKNINKLSWKVPDWVPLIGGSTFGFNLKQLTAPQIPYLANGGVITTPTVAMMGEYAGASNNPEIVTPQNLLQEIVNGGNEQLISVLIQNTRQLISAIQEIDMNVSIGDDVIANSLKRSNNAHYRRTGKPLLAYN